MAKLTYRFTIYSEPLDFDHMDLNAQYPFAAAIFKKSPSGFGELTRRPLWLFIESGKVCSLALPLYRI